MCEHVVFSQQRLEHELVFDQLNVSEFASLVAAGGTTLVQSFTGELPAKLECLESLVPALRSMHDLLQKVGNGLFHDGLSKLHMQAVFAIKHAMTDLLQPALTSTDLIKLSLVLDGLAKFTCKFGAVSDFGYHFNVLKQIVELTTMESEGIIDLTNNVELMTERFTQDFHSY